MKKLLIAIFLIAAAIQAQTYVFQKMDTSVKDNWWDMNNMYNNQGSATAKFDVEDFTADKKEGTGSVKVSYVIGAGDGWGGYIVRTSNPPTNPNSPYANTYLDISAGTKLSFWYKVTKPVVTTQQGTVFMEFKMGDYDSEGHRDLWFREMSDVNLADASAQWKQVVVDLDPFKDGGDKSKEWALQFGDGDREIQLDKIKSFEFALVYITNGSGTNTPTATGEILFDGFSIQGDRYAPPIFNFDNQASAFAIDDMGWAGADGKGSVTLTNEATDKVEGAGSLKFDYMCNASQDWGGFVAFDKAVTPPAKFDERTGLILWVKNVKAIQSAKPERAMLRVFIMENSAGQNEEWIIKVPIDLSKTSDWQRFILPFKQGKLPNGDQDPPTDAFGPKSNNGDKTFNPEKITKIRFEILAAGAGPLAGPKGEKLTGTLLLDIMQQTGFQFADKTPPAAPAVTVVKGTYSNLITWTDVPNETNEKYNIYYSTKPITDVNAPGVLTLKLNVGEGVQVWEHLLRAPQNDRDETYYYAVNCVDKPGNVGAPTIIGPITNKAKGIPTWALVTPNFKADGNLNEFTGAGIKPFEMYPSKGTATVVPGFTVKDDADNSAEVYVALDKDYMYVGANINDDVVYDDPGYYTRGNSWALDALDLEWGFYNLNTVKGHTSYQRGKYPDYHLRFNKLRLRNDHWTNEKDSLLLPGPNYYWAEKFPSGYVIEAKIKLDDLAKLRKNKDAVLDTIYVKKGYKIPFDIVINDNDGANGPEDWKNREGMISWGPFNNDGGWQYPQNLMYTWLGNDDIVPTDVEETLPLTYSLEQNYPNPFNPTTQIKYSLAKAGVVTLKVYDILGRQVAELVNKQQEAGNYTVNFDASRLSSGVYIYKIESGSFNSVKKMMLVK
ncbi:T9SS type A sorting domain-containing protein [Stygiobacter electus]|uniref:T9SS type A sorting domain-containing protein n=1 Tax=Stygiobacter electus TaxID=3032292 RepID=A0AAE3TDK6_9BACT|nr:T9SS type A sorting domain-containing protein [Stygiobacter electus]MDF1611492.1 T9SS type A sorting domain-containing protein [Stygiobacter electus]